MSWLLASPDHQQLWCWFCLWKHSLVFHMEWYKQCRIWSLYVQSWQLTILYDSIYESIIIKIYNLSDIFRLIFSGKMWNTTTLSNITVASEFNLQARWNREGWQRFNAIPSTNWKHKLLCNLIYRMYGILETVYCKLFPLMIMYSNEEWYFITPRSLYIHLYKVISQWGSCWCCK